MMVGEPPPAAGDDGWVPPDELDGFRVVRQLGRGGMGAVYLGHDDMLDRPVALKFLSAADPNAPARDRFLVEARAIARLQHPNVVGIYRIGEVLGRPYLAYELISGQSLDALAKPVPWPRALDLVLGVSRGLAAAHRRDVLHRDIKPANVMLSEAGEIKLLDFGLAKLLDATQPDAGAGAAAAAQAAAALTGRAMPDAMSDATLDASLSARTTRVVRGAGARGTGPEDALTATGAILGTPLYMAPELWRGEPATVQSDVYALGLLLYELLSGRLPHEGLRAAEIAEAVQTRDPPPIRSLCPTLPQALADVVDRAIRRRRDERFQSAQEVRDALEAIRSLYRPFGRRFGESFGEPLGEPPGPALDGDGGGTPGAPTPAAAGVAGDDDAPLITASFARIAPRADAFSARVYERLFAEHPELRAMFPIEMAGQRRKLLGALIAIVDNLQAPDRLVLLLEDLGRRHAVYGVRPENFDAVGAALLGAIGDFDDAIAEPILAAWTRAYARIAQAMQRGLAAERVTVPPGPPGSPDSNAALAGELAPTRYARNGDVGLAYQVIGNGAIDVVLVSGELTHLDAGWLWPPVTRFLRALAGLGRLIVYDGRGTGLSDADAGPGALLEDRMADLRAVLDAAGVERAALIGIAAGAAPAVLFAATHPERTRALVLYAPNARGTAGDGHPHGPSAADHDAAIAEMRAAWGEPLFLDRIAPSVSGSAAFRSHWARYLRTAASPSAAIAHHRALAAFDVRAVLPAIRVPALIVHRDGDAAVPIAAGRAVAESIPGAQFVALAGRDHLSFVGDTAALVGEIRRFLARAQRPADTTWLLAAVVAFAPGSAPVDEAVALACEREVARFRGVELACLDAGRASAMFDGPGRAVRFARAVVRRARALGVALAAGVSFDMCRFGDTDVDGAAVQLAPRVAARAAPGQILVSDGAQALLGGAIALAPHSEIDGIRLHAVIGDAD